MKYFQSMTIHNAFTISLSWQSNIPCFFHIYGSIISCLYINVSKTRLFFLPQHLGVYTRCSIIFIKTNEINNQESQLWEDYIRTDSFLPHCKMTLLEKVCSDLDIEPLYESWNITVLHLQNTNGYFWGFHLCIAPRLPGKHTKWGEKFSHFFVTHWHST